MKKHIQKRYKIATIGFLLLSIGVILFPVKRSPIPSEVQFIRNIQQLNTTTTQSHGAADQRDYLFEEETSTTGGQMGTGQGTVDIGLTVTPNTVTIPSSIGANLIMAMQQSISYTITAISTGGSYQGTFGTIQNQNTGGTMSGTYQGIFDSVEKYELPTDTNLTGSIPTSTETGMTRNCETPRGQIIADKDFVLAYQQRTDVETICNVERRICNNGVLEGSYTQSSCKENVSYSYQKKEVISYNEPVVNPLIQPGPATNAGANFSTEGKINQPKQPTNMRGSDINETVTDKGVNQTTNPKKDCTAPRGTQINHGQFVKAYKSSIGLIDVPCETELRLCVNGTLKGSYLNASCNFKNMTYSDYITNNHDITKPTPQDMVDTLTNEDSPSNLYNWFVNLFN